jgi:hypothetical protein
MVSAEDWVSSRASTRIIAMADATRRILRILPHGMVQVINGCFLPMVD